MSVISHTLDAHLAAQVLNASALVSQSDFALNPAILHSVQTIAGAEVITYTRQGSILAATIDPRQRPTLVSAVMTPAETERALSPSTTAPVMTRTTCETPCYVAYRRVTGRPDTVVAVIAETSEMSAATRAITRVILASSALGLIAMVLVGQLVAGRVTAPLDRLVEFAHHVATGDTRDRAAAGSDEIGRLGRAFNEMLDQLQASQAALVRSEKLALAGLLAARVAHDIRNPLSSIKMQSQLLRARTRDDAESQAITTAVLRNIDTVESVIRNLLEVARPGALNRRPARLNDVVTDVLRQLEPQLTHRKIRLDLHLDTALPVVSLDADRFSQALTNIIINAAEAMPNGGILDISTRPENSSIELDVCDDGTGIDEAIRDRMFDPFVSSKRDGVGLGLVNAKAVIESHGGRIELSRRTPNGTRASIWLPVGTRETAHG